MNKEVTPASSGAGSSMVISPELWNLLNDAQDRPSYCNHWLTIQSQFLLDSRRALVLDFDKDTQEYVVSALWPNVSIQTDDLLEVAGESITEQQPLVVQGAKTDSEKAEVLVSFPIITSSEVHCVAVFALGIESEESLRDAMSRLQWGSSWLELNFRTAQLNILEGSQEQLKTLLDLIAVTIEHRKYDAAISAMVTELAAQLGCDRVSYAEFRGRKNKVKALSHSGQFGQHMNLITSIGNAMDEACDQRMTLSYPNVDASGELVMRFQEELARSHGSSSIITVPMFGSRKPIGALCFEFPENANVSQGVVELCDTIGLLFAPMLRDKQGLNRSIVYKNIKALKDSVAFLLGAKYLSLKVFFLLLVGGIAYLVNSTSDYKITAEAGLEGAVQRVVATPFDGYIASSFRRAGDRVTRDELLGELDDRDLKLELIQISSERAQAVGQYREAQATGQRARTKIFKARIDQADARIELVKERIERTRIKSPFDGIVVSGDLSQSLGASVQRGEVLFEVAPLDDYRIILKVDERDIDYIKIEQPISLVLSALPNEKIESVVNKITPVSVAADGRNYFRVEAHYKADNTRLRPGMEGIAKINIDQRSLMWIWTREMVNWMRLWVWRWVS
jgi:hypothetical protein